MHFSTAVGRQVVGVDAADTVGKVGGFIVDPAEQRVVAVTVKKSGAGSVLEWTKIDSFGDAAVIVATSDAVTAPDGRVAALTGKDHELLGKRVLTSAGYEVGTIVDVDFDPVSGAVLSLLLDDENMAGDRLLGAGSYAVVVAAAAHSAPISFT